MIEPWGKTMNVWCYPCLVKADISGVVCLLCNEEKKYFWEWWPHWYTPLNTPGIAAVLKALKWRDSWKMNLVHGELFRLWGFTQVLLCGLTLYLYFLEFFLTFPYVVCWLLSCVAFTLIIRWNLPSIDKWYNCLLRSIMKYWNLIFFCICI